MNKKTAQQNVGRSKTMKMQRRYFIIIILAGLFFQINTPESFGQNQEVTIVAPYKPVISDAFKKSLNPQVIETNIEALPMSYSISSEPVFTNYEISPIKPLLIDVDMEEEMRRNYLRAGFGNYTMPYLELFTNSLSSKDFSIGFHARHLSSKGDIQDYANSAFSQNEASLNVKSYLKEKILSAKIHYDRNVVHYYGFKPDDYIADTIADDDLRQRYSLIGADLNILSNKKRADKTNYRAGLNFYHLSDLYQTNELKIGLKSNVNSKNEFFDFVDKQELGADINLDFYNNHDSLISQGTFVAEIMPFLRWNFEYLDLTVGARGVLSADSTSNFYIYPEIRASYQVIPNYLRFYASVSGGLQRNSFRSVTTENLWVNSLFPLGFTSTKYMFKGGVTGKVNESFDYNFNVAYAEVENMLFFNNDYQMDYSPEISKNFGNKFTGIYDDATVTTVSLELGYQQSRYYNVMLRAAYNDYQLKTQAKPWHKPALELVLSGKYMLTEKVSFGGELFFNSATYARVTENGNARIEENKAYADLNLGGEYRFNSRVSAFVNLNNVIGTRYSRWYNYPSQRINAMGGFTFSF
ncbi:MAG: hypothetical protein K9H16_01775 [Bacteroidales bacterium]|nr:hypothetical protein [Bacteroidales bacterium]